MAEVRMTWELFREMIFPGHPDLELQHIEIQHDDILVLDITGPTVPNSPKVKMIITTSPPIHVAFEEV